MSFRFVNDKLISRIEKTISSGNISHAYIIEGDSLVDKMGFAKDFVKEILNADDELSSIVEHENFEDLYIVRSEAGLGRSVKSIKDDDMEELQSNLKMKPHGERNFAIVDNADSMTIRAQNRFLKTLEEPPVGTVIFLLCDNQDNLLDTIKSRCISIHLFDGNKRESAFELVSAIMDGEKFTKIKKLMSEEIKTRDDAFEFLDSLENSYRTILIGENKEKLRLYSREELIQAIELVEETRRDIVLNMNYSYAIKNLVLKLEG